jgi:hypothetical protein
MNSGSGGKGILGREEVGVLATHGLGLVHLSKQYSDGQLIGLFGL